MFLLTGILKKLWKNKGKVSYSVTSDLRGRKSVSNSFSPIDISFALRFKYDKLFISSNASLDTWLTSLLCKLLWKQGKYDLWLRWNSMKNSVLFKYLNTFFSIYLVILHIYNVKITYRVVKLWRCSNMLECTDVNLLFDKSLTIENFL